MPWLLASLLAITAVVAGVALLRDQDRMLSTDSGNVEPSLCDRTHDLLNLAHEQPVAGSDASLLPLDRSLPSVTRMPSAGYPDIAWDSPEAVSAGRENASAWVSALESANFRSGLFRQWHADNGGLLQMEVMRFGSHEGALRFQDWVLGASCMDAADLFTVPDPPQAVGLQLTWPHGDRSDQVSFVVGPNRYLAAVVTAGPPPREMVLSLAEDLSSWTVKAESTKQQ